MDHGYEILLIGRSSLDGLQAQKTFPVKQFRMLFRRGFFFYAEINTRLFWTLIFKRKSLLIANDLDTLLPVFLASKLSNTPLIYDSHEYFTEVPELQNRPIVKSFWEKLERALFPRLRYVITVNEALAEIYFGKYKVPVTVLKNVPELSNKLESIKGVVRDEKLDNDEEKFLIYQGALNVGRGIELMIDSMVGLKEFKLLIVGEGDISEELKAQVVEMRLEDRILFQGRLLPDQLKKLTPTAVLGLSLEEDLGQNYRYALPNKLFDYIHAGIPVIVSDLPVMSKIVQEYGVGEVLKDRTPQGLSELIRKIHSKKESYEATLVEAVKKLNWNQEKKTFQKLLDHLENLE